jgi:hypothetical protein
VAASHHWNIDFISAQAYILQQLELAFNARIVKHNINNVLNVSDCYNIVDYIVNHNQIKYQI